MSNFEDNNGRLKIVETCESSDVKEEEISASAMSGDRPQKRSGRRPGRRSAKMDVRAKLERSRQSARECRARKKLRYQYLEDLVANREKAVFALRSELEMYKTWCSQLDKGLMPLMLLKITEEIDRTESQSVTSESKGMKESTISEEIEVVKESNSEQETMDNDTEKQLSKSLLLAGVSHNEAKMPDLAQNETKMASRIPNEAKKACQIQNEAKRACQIQNEAEIALQSQNEAKMAPQSQNEVSECQIEAARSDNLDLCPRFDDERKYPYMDTASKFDLVINLDKDDFYFGLNSATGSSLEDDSWEFCYGEDDFMTVVPAKNSSRTLKSNLPTIIEEEES